MLPALNTAANSGGLELMGRNRLYDFQLASIHYNQEVPKKQDSKN